MVALMRMCALCVHAGTSFVGRGILPLIFEEIND